MIINPSIQDIKLSPIVCWDLETTGLQAWKERIDLIALKTPRDEYILEAAKYEKKDLVSLFKRLGNCNVTVAHSFKFDAGFVYYHYGVLLRNGHCTKMSAEICENGRQKSLRAWYKYPFSLTSVLKRWKGILHSSAEDKKELQKSFTKGIDYERFTAFRREQMEYALEDVRHLYGLYEDQIAKIDELGLRTIYRLEHKLLPILVKTEMEGCLIDKKGWANLIDTVWEKEKIEIENRLDEEVEKLLDSRVFKYSIERGRRSSVQYDIFGNSTVTELKDDNELNYGSTEQILELIQFLKQPLPTDPHGKPSTEEEALLVYLTENSGSVLDKFITILLEYRKITKLLTTYGHSFLAKLDDKNHIHTLYTQTDTESGRLSSKAPNLQNIPAAPKKNQNKDIRRFFIARPGHKLITCDMTSAEIAIAGDYSGEPLLIDSLTKGVDMHSELATSSFSTIFNRPVKISKSEEEITIDDHVYVLDELRTSHKNAVFAKFYKGGPKRIYGVLSEYINNHCSKETRMIVAKKISDDIDSKLPKLSAYLSSLIEKARRDGFLRTSSFGRIRYFQSDVFGEAANAPIQGTNSEALKMAMVRLEEYIDSIKGRLVLNTHDETVYEVPDEFVPSAAKMIEKEMSGSLSHFLRTIKGSCETKIANHWKK